MPYNRVPLVWTPLAIMQFGIAVACLACLFLIAVLSYFYEPPEANASRLDMITGGLLTVGFANIIGFLYGQKEAVDQVRKATGEGYAAAALNANTGNSANPQSVRVDAEHVTIPGSPVSVTEHSDGPEDTSVPTPSSPRPDWLDAPDLEPAAAGAADASTPS